MVRRLKGKGPVIIFCVALAIRMGFILVFGEEFLNRSNDASTYHDIAVNLVTQGRYFTANDPPHRFEVPYGYRPPLVPFVLAATYSIFGTRVLAGQVVMAIIGGLGSAVLFYLGRLLFSASVGLLAGLLAAFYPFFILLSAVPLTESLAITLFPLLALCLFKAVRTKKASYEFLTGILLGMVVLNKPTALGIVPLLPVWFLVIGTERKKALTGLAAICGGALLAIFPWLVRQALVLGTLVPVTPQAGGALYYANNPYGWYPLERLENGEKGWLNHPRSGVDLGNIRPVEEDKHLRQLAFQFIRSHPQEFVNYTYRRVLIFWKPYGHVAHRWSWYPIALLAIFGLIVTRRQWKELSIIYLMIIETALIPVFFISLPRYRASIEPFLLLFAAAGILWFASLVTRR